MLRSQAAFEASVDELTRHVQDRCQAVRAYLGE
jgi:hypothetical protein